MFLCLFLFAKIQKKHTFAYRIVKKQRIIDEKIVKDLIDRLIDLSFADDIGDGDHTTLSSIPADAMGKSKLLIKEEGIWLVSK